MNYFEFRTSCAIFAAMEEKKNKNSWFDFLVIALSVVVGQMISSQLNIEGEMKNFIVTVAIVVFLMVTVYLIKYWLVDKHDDGQSS